MEMNAGEATPAEVSRFRCRVRKEWRRLQPSDRKSQPAKIKSFNIQTDLGVKRILRLFGDCLPIDLSRTYILTPAGKSINDQRCCEQMGEWQEEGGCRRRLSFSFFKRCNVVTVCLCDALRRRSVARRPARPRPCCCTARCLPSRRWTPTCPRSPAAGETR